jgi:hypothetical protein
MKISKRLALSATAAVAVLGLAAQPLHAFDAAKNTLFSVTDPIRVGDRTLGAGTYVIRVVNHATDLNLLQVTDPATMAVYATFQARQRSVLDLDISPEGTLTFDDVPGQPNLLRSWKVPNRSFGYDVVTSVPRPENLASLTVRGSPLVKAAR